MSKTKDSTAVTEAQFEDTKKGTASREQQNPVNLESVPRSVAGVVNNTGDVLDDAGNIIGKIADIDSLKHFVGNDVNSAGDIVSSPCDVFGETLPLGQEQPGKENQEEQQEEHSSHDDEYREYTTQEVEKKSDRLDVSHLKDTAGRLTGAVSDAGKSAVGGGIGALDLGGKPDETPEAPKQVEEAIGQMPEVKTKAGAEQIPEERLQREQAEQVKAKRKEEVKKDKKLASALAYNIDQTQDKIRPICKMINDNISASEAQLREEHSEEELVRKVRPLIKEGAKILADLNGVIRGLDPAGRIQRNAKQKAPIAEATPEEYHVAELVKELTGNITATIDNARRKVENMPHAKKELNPF